MRYTIACQAVPLSRHTTSLFGLGSQLHAHATGNDERFDNPGGGRQFEVGKQPQIRFRQRLRYHERIDIAFTQTMIVGAETPSVLQSGMNCLPKKLSLMKSSPARIICFHIS